MIPKALGKFRPRTSESRRIPLEREISFRVPRFENFVTEYSANISATGIFIRTQDPLEPGTDLSLEFKVADDWKLVRGRGRVIWIRNRDEGMDKPAGMGIRFLEMDPQSRRLIHWMVDKQAREGGETFEFDKLRQTADEALGEAFDGPEEAAVGLGSSGGSYAARRAGLGRRLLLVAGAAALIVLLVWLLQRPVPTPAEPGGAPASAPAAAAPEAGAAEPGETALPGASAASSGARSLIERWADAWSEARVDEYLATYSERFQPPGGVGRRQWEATRRERLSTPQYIRVSITALELRVEGPDRVRATFFQNYRSDRFEDTVRKELLLTLEEGNWRILEERVV